MRASQETGRMTTGTLAGLWTGLLGVFIPSLISIVFVLVNIDSYRKGLQSSADKLHQNIIYTNSMVLTGLLINVLFLLIVGILPGAIGGLVGGTIWAGGAFAFLLLKTTRKPCLSRLLLRSRRVAINARVGRIIDCIRIRGSYRLHQR